MADLGNIGGDTVLGLLFGLGAVVSLGIGEASLLGYTLSDTFAVGGQTLTYANAMSIAAILGVLGLNTPKFDRMNEETKLLAGAAVVLVGVGTFAPDLLEPVTAGQSMTLAVAVWAVESGGFWALATSK